MKEHLHRLVQNARLQTHAHFVAREYLQVRILAILQRCGAMIPLAFHGGTALRLLYSLPRFSEDLDFTLERPEGEPNRMPSEPQLANFDFRKCLKSIKSTLEAETYDVDIKINTQNVVNSAFVKFRGLVYDLGLSPHQNQVMSIKLEVDTHPPAGAVLATSIVRRHMILRLQHHDRSSLLAGKLHALLQRPYPKGRDVYDLFWYLSDPAWPAPNLIMLNNALSQSGWDGEEMSEESWPRIIQGRISELLWERVLADVQPFLELDEAAVLTKENLLRLLDRRQ